MIEKSEEQIIKIFLTELKNLKEKWTDPLLSLLSEVKKNKDLTSQSFEVFKNIIEDFFDSNIYEILIEKLHKYRQREDENYSKYLEEVIRYVLTYGDKCYFTRRKIFGEINNILEEEIENTIDPIVKEVWENKYQQIMNKLYKKAREDEESKLFNKLFGKKEDEKKVNILEVLYKFGLF